MIVHNQVPIIDIYSVKKLIMIYQFQVFHKSLNPSSSQWIWSHNTAKQMDHKLVSADMAGKPIRCRGNCSLIAAFILCHFITIQLLFTSLSLSVCVICLGFWMGSSSSSEESRGATGFRRNWGFAAKGLGNSDQISLHIPLPHWSYLLEITTCNSLSRTLHSSPSLSL